MIHARIATKIQTNTVIPLGASLPPQGGSSACRAQCVFVNTLSHTITKNLVSLASCDKSIVSVDLLLFFVLLITVATANFLNNGDSTAPQRKTGRTLSVS